jgi:hypothetical protein
MQGFTKRSFGFIRCPLVKEEIHMHKTLITIIALSFMFPQTSTASGTAKNAVRKHFVSNLLDGVMTTNDVLSAIESKDFFTKKDPYICYQLGQYHQVMIQNLGLIHKNKGLLSKIEQSLQNHIHEGLIGLGAYCGQEVPGGPRTIKALHTELQVRKREFKKLIALMSKNRVKE